MKSWGWVEGWGKRGTEGYGDCADGEIADCFGEWYLEWGASVIVMRVSAFERVCRCCRYKLPCYQDGFSLLRNTSLMHLSFCLIHLSSCAPGRLRFFSFVNGTFCVCFLFLTLHPVTLKGLSLCLVVFVHLGFVAQSIFVDLAALLTLTWLLRVTVRWDWST